MKNALLIVLAFALGGGVVWYVTKDGGDSGAGTSFPAAAGGRSPAGGFGGGGRPQAQPPLVTVGRAKRDSIYDVVEALGTAQANESVTLTAKVTDTVRRLLGRPPIPFARFVRDHRSVWTGGAERAAASAPGAHA